MSVSQPMGTQQRPLGQEGVWLPWAGTGGVIGFPLGYGLLTLEHSGLSSPSPAHALRLSASEASLLWALDRGPSWDSSSS